MINETTTPENVLRAIHFDFNLIPYERWITEVSIIKGRGNVLRVYIQADHSTRDSTKHTYEFWKSGVGWGGYETSYVDDQGHTCVIPLPNEMEVFGP